MKKVITLPIIIGLIALLVFMVFEPQITKAITDEVFITVDVTSEISFTATPNNVAMTPTIHGVIGNAGNPASGDATWQITTNNSTGFNMKINATNDPALYLDAAYEFTDYTPASAGSPDYSWSSPAASAAEFGFTVEASTDADTDQLFLDNGVDECDTGSTAGSDTCWYDFNGQNDIDIIDRGTETSSGGEDIKVKFRAESNAKYLKEGTYAATITVTVAENP